MKKFFITLFAVILFQCIVNANYNDIYIADIQYDWINKKEVEKESIISEVRDIIFKGDDISSEKNLKSTFKDRLKDKDYIDHYMAASAGYKEYKDFYISAFYAKNNKHIYMYALQDKKDVSKSFYYDALGHLRYVDYIYGEYPDYPYYAIQYRISGKPVSAIYYVSKDNQYLFEPDGKFKGVWYKHNMYDEHSKVILKRTTY